MGPEGAWGLVPLRKCLLLAHVELGDNNFGDSGARWISQVFADCTALSYLDLSWNRIGLLGATALSCMLENWPGLQHLDLGFNCKSAGFRVRCRRQEAGARVGSLRRR